jgi:hypothetical protein
MHDTNGPFRTCLRLFHFTNFNLASQITCQTPPTSPKKCEVGPNFDVFMKQQNRCFTNSFFELSRESEGKFPTVATAYIKNGSFYCSITSPSCSRQEEKNGGICDFRTPKTWLLLNRAGVGRFSQMTLQFIKGYSCGIETFLT